MLEHIPWTKGVSKKMEKGEVRKWSGSISKYRIESFGGEGLEDIDIPLNTPVEITVKLKEVK